MGGKNSHEKLGCCESSRASAYRVGVWVGQKGAECGRVVNFKAPAEARALCGACTHLFDLLDDLHGCCRPPLLPMAGKSRGCVSESPGKGVVRARSSFLACEPDVRCMVSTCTFEIDRAQHVRTAPVQLQQKQEGEQRTTASAMRRRCACNGRGSAERSPRCVPQPNQSDPSVMPRSSSGWCIDRVF